jgi:hypothetical protein
MGKRSYYEFKDLISYLNSKKVPFAVKTVYKDNKPYSKQLVGIKKSKSGKFYRANGKIISRQYYETLKKYV